MCHDCFVVRKGKEPRQIDCCGDIADEFGIEVSDLPLNCDDPREPLEKNECLCWIDFDALGKRFGFSVDEPSFSPKAGLNFDAWLMTEAQRELVERAR